MSIKIIDTHCHLDMEEFDEDRETVIEHSKAEKVEAVIMPSTKEEDFEKERLLCETYSGFLYYLVGIHPHDAKTCTNSTLNEAVKHLKYKFCKGVGEIGLDYYYERSQRELQKDVFSSFLDIAIENEVPVSIHSREATDDMVDILKSKAGLKGVIHCFSGDEKLLKVGLEMGLYFGIGGVLTFKNSLLRKNIDKLPLEYIVFETDAPYLAPVPKRGKRNDPSYIRFVLKELARLVEKDEEYLSNIAYNNAKAIFGI